MHSPLGQWSSFKVRFHTFLLATFDLMFLENHRKSALKLHLKGLKLKKSPGGGPPPRPNLTSHSSPHLILAQFRPLEGRKGEKRKLCQITSPYLAMVCLSLLIFNCDLSYKTGFWHHPSTRQWQYISNFFILDNNFGLIHFLDILTTQSRQDYNRNNNITHHKLKIRYILKILLKRTNQVYYITQGIYNIMKEKYSYY